jgi:ribosomal protein uS2
MAGIIDNIKEKVEEGEKAIEEIVERVEEKLEEKGKKKTKKSLKSKKGDEGLSNEEIKEAELESVMPDIEQKKNEILASPSKDVEQKKKELLEKAKKLAEKIEKTETEELKEKVRGKKKGEMLVQLEEYVKSGIYLGTKVVTPQMKQFVYRRRADGLAIFNTDLIDEKLKEGIEFIGKFDAKDIILVCKRQAGWKTAEMLGKITGIKVFTKKYPAGILTNTALPDFFENELTIACDSWLDKNALNDTLNVHKKVLMICDTNNFPKGADQIIIGNNKSARSLGLIFYLITKEFCKAKGIKADIPDLDWWASEEEKGAEMGV